MRFVRKALAAASLAALAVAHPAAAQSDQRGPGMGTGGPGMGGQGMGGQGMGGMRGMTEQMHHDCRQMMQGREHGLPRLPEGNEKLELQMHAEMMRAMGDILAKYAARLPDKK